MTGIAEVPVQGDSVELQVLQMTQGIILHHALCTAARLGVADLLSGGERSSEDLARELSVHEDALYRLLRFLAGQGVFIESAPRTFTNSHLSQTMRSEWPGSVRPVLLFRAMPFYLAPFQEMTYSVETSKSARDKVLGMNGFEYLREHPEEARIFDEAMTAITFVMAPSIAAAYDFGQWGSLADVGGGNGLFLAAILKAHPQLRGVLADLDHVIQRARQRGFLSGELAARASFTPCDFFREVPAGCRAYVMKSVIHDWDDEASIRILRNCRQAVPEDGALLLVEHALGENNEPSMGKATDLIMLVATGGKERTVHEYAALLASGGFRLRHTTSVGHSLILEAVPDGEKSC